MSNHERFCSCGKCNPNQAHKFDFEDCGNPMCFKCHSKYRPYDTFSGRVPKLMMEFKEESKVNPFLPTPPTLPAAKSTFDRAFKLIGGERRDAYGAYNDETSHIAAMWNAILKGDPVTARKVPLMMVAMKLCREATSHRADNLDDACGYIGLLSELEAINENQK